MVVRTTGTSSPVMSAVTRKATVIVPRTEPRKPRRKEKPQIIAEWV